MHDKAGKEYWEIAESNLVVRSFDPSAPGIRNHAKRQWQRFFTAWLAGWPPGSRLIELGCGGSAMLPYFRKHFGFDIAGLDYSENGCRLARQLCRDNGCAARIVCADVFDPPVTLLGSYDIVISFGLVEHFTDTAAALAAFGRFLRRGGTIITTAPNMAGWPGITQRLFEPDIFWKHVALTPRVLEEAHRQAGLQPLASGCFQFVNFGVINPVLKDRVLRRLAFQALRALTAVAWVFEETVFTLPANRFTSPYVFTVATLNR